MMIVAGCEMNDRHDMTLDPVQMDTVSEKQLTSYSTASLRAAADSLYEFQNGKDRACIIYKILTTRYLKAPEDAETGVHANMKLWNRHTFDFKDVSGAMEYLNAAADICETHNIVTAEVPYGYATSYQIMGNHTREQELNQKALKYYEEAFPKIRETGEAELYDRMVTNYLTLLYSSNEPMRRGDAFMDQYAASLNTKKSDSMFNFNQEFYKGLIALQERRLRQSVAHFRHMRDFINGQQSKQLYLAILNEATAFQESGMVAEALRVLDKAEPILEKTGDIDIKVSMYYTKYKYWEILKDTARQQQYYILYCQMRDSLLSYNQITGIRKAEYSQSMTRMGHRLSNLEYNDRIKTVVIWTTAIITVLLIGFIFIIRNKNKRLRQSNRSLYEQNQAVLMAEKREREERRRYAELTEEIKQEDPESTKSEEKSGKYSSRKLKGDTKNEIHDMILNVMEINPEIFNSDFSLARLSEICGSRPEYVSQVINESYGCNFNELVNKYRIREACRRIDDKGNYGQFTLAAIASGVGIESATTFSKYFKKITGLTPSQYKKNSDAQSEIC
jgi:YesN/AraC family two-component response regulator